jgi:hypothetical protein
MKVLASFGRRAVTTALFSLAASYASAQPFNYRATVESAPVDRVGAVNANGLIWQCSGNACTITGPWPIPGVTACANLARLVGRIASYGHSSRMLNAIELAQCNSGMPQDGAVARPVATPAVVVDPVARPVGPAAGGLPVATPSVAQPILVVRANNSLRYTGQRAIGQPGITTRVLRLP